MQSANHWMAADLGQFHPLSKPQVAAGGRRQLSAFGCLGPKRPSAPLRPRFSQDAGFFLGAGGGSHADRRLLRRPLGLRRIRMRAVGGCATSAPTSSTACRCRPRLSAAAGGPGARAAVSKKPRAARRTSDPRTSAIEFDHHAIRVLVIDRDIVPDNVAQRSPGEMDIALCSARKSDARF